MNLNKINDENISSALHRQKKMLYVPRSERNKTYNSCPWKGSKLVRNNLVYKLPSFGTDFHT